MNERANRGDPTRDAPRFGPGAIVLLGLTVLAFAPALGAGFVWDDDHHVTNNPMLRDAEGLRRIWLDTSATPQYYPLTHTSFWLERRLWGLRPAGYHAVNVLLHAIGAVLAWRVLRELRVPGAWLAAAIFAIHPVQVESVAWISERKNVLSGVFYLASALAFLRASPASPGEGRESPWGRAAAVVWFGLAVLSKTVTSTLPLALALVLVWRRGSIARRSVAWLAPMLVAGAVMGRITATLEREQIGAEGAEWSLGYLERLIVAGRALWFYVGKLAWPSDLAFIYPRFDVSTADPAQVLAPVAALAALVALWWARTRIGAGPFVAFAFFALTLVPALGFFNVYPHRYSFVADHFQYLASLGPIALAAAVWARLAPRVGRPAAIAAAVVLLGLLSSLTWSRCGAFRDRETLWEDTLEKNPSAWIAHNNLGALRAERGELAEGIEHFRAVIRLRPEHAGARANLGIALLRLGRPDEAIGHLAESVRLDPDHAGNRLQLGDALAARNRLEEAREQYREAVGLDPANADAHFRLGSLLVRRGEVDRGIEHLRSALRLRPAFDAARRELEATTRLPRTD